MKNPDEWMADIKQKAALRLEERHRRRRLVLRCGASTAAVAFAGVSVFAYFSFLKAHPEPVAAESSESVSAEAETSGSVSTEAESSRPAATISVQSAVSAIVSKTAGSSGGISAVSSPIKSAPSSAALSQSTKEKPTSSSSYAPAVNGTTVVAGLADVYPNITFNNTHYNIDCILGDNPSKFVGAYRAAVKDFFVRTGPRQDVIETDKVYDVNGFGRDIIICADTSKGWEFFESDKIFECRNGAQLYGESGLNLKNLYVGAAYNLSGKNACSLENPPAPQPLSLSKETMDGLFDFLVSQKMTDLPSGPDSDYSLHLKLGNGTTVSVLLEQKGTRSYITYRGNSILLSDFWRRTLLAACR